MKIKCLIVILLVLMIVPIVYALQECTGIMNPSDMPCSIISSWQFPDACNTYTIQVYNQTPTLLRNATMDTYGITARCNITFGVDGNETKIGSYLLNWSSGDSAKIIVEADEMSYIPIGILLGVITFMFAYMATKMKHWYLQIGLSLLTLVMVIFDFFISARILEAVDASQTGIIHYLDTFFFIGVIIFRFALTATVIFLMYYMYKYVITNPRRKRELEDERIYE